MMPTTIFRAFKPELRDTNLPTGVIGQVAGIAVMYDTLDDYGTMFGRTSLHRTMKERVAAGKVKLYWDHGDAPLTGFYDSDLHIGTVRSLEDVQVEPGKWGAYMIADIFDTPKGNEAKQYLQGVLASGGETGLSVGGRAKGIKSEMVSLDGQQVERFTEFPLREISITSMQAVPNSSVLAVRQEDVLPLGEDTVVTPTITTAYTTNGTASFPAGFTVFTTPVSNQAAALRALLRALPEDVVRAEFRAFFGNATTEDSDAETEPQSSDSDATAEDSQPVEQPVAYASMDERLTALRSLYRKAD